MQLKSGSAGVDETVWGTDIFNRVPGDSETERAAQITTFNGVCLKMRQKSA